MKKSLIVKIQTVLILNKKSSSAQKIKAKCFTTKTFSLKSPTAMDLDMEKFAEETDIKNSDGNDLIAKANALKSFENLIISAKFSY